MKRKMEEKWNSRTKLLIGKEAVDKLEKAKVAIYGIGGVGSYVAEGLARAGVGELFLIDNDIISVSNINRQIHATINTIGKKKTEVMKARLLEINPDIKVTTYMAEELEQGEEKIIDTSFSYVVDAVDTVTTKLKLIETCYKQNVPIISAMGAGNKLDPTRFEVTDIYKTSVCPLAKVMRKELKARNIKKLKVVYSKEEPIKLPKIMQEVTSGVQETKEEENTRKRTSGSISFVPSVVGLIIAGEVTKDIIRN